MSALTRSEFLRAAAGAAGLLALGDPASAGAREAARSSRALSFHSAPSLHPPAATISGASAAHATASEGYFFVAPTANENWQGGPLILDTDGQPVWFKPVPRPQLATNFQVQSYDGQLVLTWWEGQVAQSGYGRGEGVIVDGSYTEIARVRAGRGRAADLHEFTLTPEGTALITCYPSIVAADLSPVGGPKRGQVYESIIQEVDVRSGRVLFEWRSLEHIGVSESYLAPGIPYDYAHVNSIDVAEDGNLIVSARHTWAVYKLARHSGRVMWRLGGRRSHFAMRPGARFSWQHDARQPTAGVITLFDDGAGPSKIESQSRGIVLGVDTPTRTVELERSYKHPNPLLSFALGSMRSLPDGNVVIGWGTTTILSEFAPAGSLLTDVRLPFAADSYRALRCAWSATPGGPPAIAAVTPPGASVSTVYASWNGATAVADWRLATGPTASRLQPVQVVPRAGFETAIPTPSASGYAAVTALDAAGRALATSEPAALG